MATTLNAAHASAIAAATGAIFNGGSLPIRTGAPPGADNADTGILLAIVVVSDPAYEAGNPGEVVNAAVWQGTVLVTGAPGYFRLYDTGQSQNREGDVGDASAPAGEAMLIAGLVAGDLIEGGVITIGVGDYSLTQPAA